MVHSAFARFSRIGFDLDDVLTAFLDYMKHGTILFPTMSWQYVNPKTPIFYIDKTPSNTRILTELFRQKYAEKRSLHPTRIRLLVEAICVAKFFQPITLTQHLVPSLAHLGNYWNLMLKYYFFGISIDCCSLIHHGEELYALEHYLVPKDAACSYPCRMKKVASQRFKLENTNYLKETTGNSKTHWLVKALYPQKY